MNKMITVRSMMIITIISFSLISIAQTDTTSIEGEKISRIEYKKNNLCIDLPYTLTPLIDDDYKSGFGLSYERILKMNRSIVVDIDHLSISDESQSNTINRSYFTIKSGYRFYLKKEYNKRRERVNPAGCGFYLTPLISIGLIYFESTEYNFMPRYVTDIKNEYRYKFRFGGGIGYQYIIKNIIVLNIDFPFMSFYYNINYPDTQTDYIERHIPISLNLGVSF